MKILISPAKSLDFKSKLPTNRSTQPRFLETTFKINKKLKRTSLKQLSKLMGISPKLADLNYQRNQEFQENHDKENSRPAVYAFNGDVYMGLDAYSIPIEKLDDLQEKVRILSGLYGILRPLDLIQPYRLEMGSKLPVGRKKDLYQLWQEKITDSLNEEMEDGELLINLASQEYFKAVDSKKLKAKILSPIFKDFKNGELKIISFFAKKARGSMTRYILDKDISDLENIKGFDYDGYSFSEKETEIEEEPVFIR
jgi:cytoplasmic iron level regulating protein YaaA (DUF328/UPF0246 family)